MSVRARISLPIERLLSALIDPSRRDRTAIVALAVYAAVWTLYGILTQANQGIHFDTAGIVAWSHELALGYAAHPPLAVWIVRGWLALFPAEDWVFRLLAMTWAGIALWLSWLLLGRFLDADKRVAGLALLTLIPFYNFLALKFDHNALLVPLWTATVLCFIRSVETRSAGWAALAGLAAAAAMLGKYWSIVLLASLGLAALVDPRRAKYFRSRAPWITIAVGALTLTPHLAWLGTHDFASIFYAAGAHAASTAEAAQSTAAYLASAAGYAGVPVLLALIASRSTPAAIADLLLPPTPDRRLVAVAHWGITLLPVAIALALGFRLDPIWLTSSYVLLPVVLLSSPLLSFTRSAVVGIVWLAVLFPLVMTAAAPLIATIEHRQGAAMASVHGRVLAQRIAEQWHQSTDRPLLLVGGDLDLAYVAAFYLPGRPAALPLAEPQMAPWVDDEQIIRKGIALVCYSREDHKGDRTCVHKPIIDRIERIVVRNSLARQVDIELVRTHWGIAGQPQRYLIFTVPPRP